MTNSNSQPDDSEKDGLSTQSQTDLLLKARGIAYGDVKHNMTCWTMLKGAYHLACRSRGLQIPNQMVHDGLMEMALLKVARIATAGEYVPDNYDDVVGYVRLAQQMAEETQLGEQEDATAGKD